MFPSYLQQGKSAVTVKSSSTSIVSYNRISPSGILHTNSFCWRQIWENVVFLSQSSDGLDIPKGCSGSAIVLLRCLLSDLGSFLAETYECHLLLPTQTAGNVP